MADRLPRQAQAEAAPVPEPRVPAHIAQPPKPVTREEMDALIRAALLEVQMRQAQTQQNTLPQQQWQTQQAKEKADEKKQKRRWVGAQPTDMGIQSPTTATGKEPEKEGTPHTKAAGLITDATWAKPVHPRAILYQDQFIPGILQNDINSDIPGKVLIRVTRDVQDRLLSGVILIPQFSTLVGTQEGKTQYGDERLNVMITQIIYPDGTVIGIAKAPIGDATGATGLEAIVNNHIPKLLLAVGISAILNIGAQAAAGTPSNGQYYQNPAQQAAQNIGQDVQRNAEKIVDRQLRKNPTLTKKAGAEVSVSLNENLNFGKAPLKVP
jgi:type IV secretion system protein VirB10